MIDELILSSDLNDFGLWLIDEANYGHGLLVLHGVHMGLKLKDQLKLKWMDLIKEDRIVETIHIKGDIKRQINQYVSEITLKVFEESKLKLTDSVYQNKKHKPIVNRNLKVDFSRFYRTWKMVQRSERNLIIISIKEQDYELSPKYFERCWARDYVNSKSRQSTNLEAVKHLSKSLKHRSVAYTVELFGLQFLEPSIDFRFDYAVPVDYSPQKLKTNK